VSFDGQKDKVGREPNYLVELDLDRCSWTYGVGTCTANGGAGAQCYNTLETCQVPSVYAQRLPTGNGPLVVKFSRADAAPIFIDSTPIAPAVKSVNIAPTKLAPGRGLSSRSRVDIQLIDFTDNDLQTDPYAADRNYIATDQGTFFGKLFARNPHYVGRALRVKLGYFNDDGSADSTNFDRVYNYIIDRIDGPDANGVVKIIGKDVLSLTEALKTKIPEASTGTLESDVSHGGSSHIDLQDGEAVDYPAPGVVRIGDELIAYTTSNTATDRLSGLTRGYGGSPSHSAGEVHEAGESVQLCLEYGFSSTQRVDAVVADLLTTYAGIPASAITTADWTAEANQWLTNYNLQNIISEPTELNKLLDQICVECGVDIWVDDVANKIRFKAQVPTTAENDCIGDNVILRNKASIQHQVKDRLSQVYFYTGKRNQAGSRSEVGNYTNVVARVDVNSEGANEYNQKGIKKVFCQWVQGSALAGQQATRLLNRYKVPPIMVKADIDISQTQYATGDLFDICTELYQSVTGEAQTREMQMLSTQVDAARQVIKIEALQFLSSVGRPAFITPNGTAPYTTALGDANPTYSWISDSTTNLMPNGDNGYEII
tara:strand:- start:8023 stop:9822 length:1800 start_codon:yes stop_codon:yes gene_type:complete